MGERCRLYMTRGQKHTSSHTFSGISDIMSNNWIHPDATGEFVKQSQLAASANALGNNFLAPDAELQSAELPFKK